MKWNWRSMFVVAGLGLGVGLVAPSCVVRAGVGTTGVVDQQPPAPQYETPAARSGFLWVQGNWEWRNNQWKWQSGRWERQRAGQTYTASRWERRGDRWHFVRGRWVAGSSGTANATVRDHRTPAPTPDPTVRDHRTPTPTPTPGPTVRDHRTPAPSAYPTQAPPAPRYQTPGFRVTTSGRVEHTPGPTVTGSVPRQLKFGSLAAGLHRTADGFGRLVAGQQHLQQRVPRSATTAQIQHLTDARTKLFQLVAVYRGK